MAGACGRAGRGKSSGIASGSGVRLDLNAIGIEFVEVIEPRCVGDGSENG